MAGVKLITIFEVVIVSALMPVIAIERVMKGPAVATPPVPSAFDDVIENV
jgi:hypothetical protein